ncbi:MAG: 4'-phosphopantetheinyl transferase superfamily protein [Solirubrobacterales bacterium]|nr:4'-phosphopantetheinyl transferase superfamily protein [Solirubrobacterales bacterium]
MPDLECPPQSSRSHHQEWPLGPQDPKLDGQEVHVWRIDLLDVDERSCHSLSVAELERAHSILSARRSALWRRSRHVLRLLLGRYLNVEARMVELTVGSGGKPALALAGRSSTPTQSERSQLTFNLSHSGRLALCAFTRSGQVGIDVEQARPAPGLSALSDRVFGAEEATRIAALVDPGERERELLRGWTLREAALKCHGAAEATPDLPRASQPWLHALDPGAGAVATLAAERANLTVRQWSWHPPR